MANTYKNIVITPNRDTDAANVPFIRFSGGDATSNTDINVRVYTTQSGTLSFEGSAGQLFSITNDLTNTIFSVNDVSGIPSLEIDAAGLIKLAEFGGNVAIGRSNASHKLDIVGTVNASNILVNGNRVFTAANDGAGSNLDADLLDGQQGTYYGIATDVTGAFASANAGQATANASFNRANTANITADRAWNHANAAFATANVAFANANTVMISAQAAFTVANSGFIHANAAFATVNSAFATINVAFANANTVMVSAQAAFTVANAAFLHANAAFATVNSAFGIVNTAVQNTASVTFAGNSVFALYPLFSADSYASSNLVVRNQSGFYETSYGTTANGWPVDTGSWQHALSITHSNDSNYYAMQLASSFFAQDWYLRNTNGSGTTGWSKIWHNNNDGTGSGLDADLLDGQHGSYYGIASDLTAAFNRANTANITADRAWNHANAVFAAANADYAFSNSAHAIANLAFTHANGAFNKANAALANTAGISTAGGLVIPGILVANTGGGTLQIRAGGTSDHTYIEYYPRSNTGSRGAYVGYGSAATNNFSIINETTTGSLQLGTAGGADITIDSAGNVGIGRTNPGFILDVVGTANASNILVNGNMVFTTANDGAGSNLDADFLDGQHGSYYGIASDVTGAFASANAGQATANAAFNRANTANITADRAWNHANAAFATANVAFANANTVMISAQAAFTVANSGFVHANSAFATVNSAFATINVAFANANTVMISSQAAFTVANSGFIHANAAFATVNSAFATINVAFANANTVMISAQAAFTVANSGFIHANAAFATVNSAFATINVAFANANTVMISSQAAFTVANSGFIHANSGYAFANSIAITANLAFAHANAAFANGNTVIQTAQSAFTQANTARDHANAAFLAANNAGGATLGLAFDQANTARSHANAAFASANIAFANANTVMISAQAAFTVANSGFIHANAAFATVNSAFARANAALSNTAGSTFNGNLIISGIFVVTVANTSSLDFPGEIAEFVNNANTYAQIHVRNANTQQGASVDIVATADTGTDVLDFIDLGINNSGYSQPTWTINGPRDGYLYASHGNLAIGSANVLRSVTFFTGGTLAANERARIDPTGNLLIGRTGSTVGQNVKLDVNGAVNASAILVNGTPLSSGGASVFSANVGNTSANTFNVAHNLNKTFVIPAVRENSSGYYVYPDMRYTTPNHIVLEFANAPSTNQYTVIVLG